MVRMPKRSVRPAENRTRRLRGGKQHQGSRRVVWRHMWMCMKVFFRFRFESIFIIIYTIRTIYMFGAPIRSIVWCFERCRNIGWDLNKIHRACDRAAVLKAIMREFVGEKCGQRRNRGFLKRVYG